MGEFIATGWKRVEKVADTGLKAAWAGVPEPGVEGMDLAGLVRGAQEAHRKALASTYPRYHSHHRYNLAQE